MFERGMAWFVLRDPPSHDTSASHGRSPVCGGVQSVFLFPALHSPAYAYRVGESFAHENHSRIALPHRFNPIVSHRNPLAKYVAHFFIKSRSIFTSANSRFTLDSTNSTSVSAS